MISDQGVQPGQPRHPFGQTPPHEPVPGGIHNLNIVMIFCPVVTDEQHRDLGSFRFDPTTAASRAVSWEEPGST